MRSTMSHDTGRALARGVEMTDVQRSIYENTRALAVEAVAPGAAQRDEKERFPSDHIAQLAEHGLLAMKVSEADGGFGADNVGYVFAMSAIAEADASVAVI